MLGHGPHPHTRARAEPSRAGPGAGGVRPRPADTNAVRFRGLLRFFGNSWDPFKRIGSARYNHSRMITDSLGLLQTERSAEDYKYPISARIFYKKQKSICPLSPINFLHKTVFLLSEFGAFLNVVLPLTGNKPPSEQRPDSSS